MNTPNTEIPANSRRKRGLIAIAAIFGLAGAAWGGWWATHGRFMEHTDDAYVAGNVVQITPQVAGTVISIDADDTQLVKAGEDLQSWRQAWATVDAQKLRGPQRQRMVEAVAALRAQVEQLQAELGADQAID